MEPSDEPTCKAVDDYSCDVRGVAIPCGNALPCENHDEHNFPQARRTSPDEQEALDRYCFIIGDEDRALLERAVATDYRSDGAWFNGVVNVVESIVEREVVRLRVVGRDAEVIAKLDNLPIEICDYVYRETGRADYTVREIAYHIAAALRAGNDGRGSELRERQG